jgi:hypothetical protein
MFTDRLDYVMDLGKAMVPLGDLVNNLDVRQATSSLPPALGGLPPAALDYEGELVLRILAESPRRRLSVLKIWTGLKRKIAEKTIRDRVRLLVKAGLAERNDGPKSGVAITEAGKDLHRDLSQV